MKDVDIKLIEAIRSMNCDLIKALILQGADINCDHGETFRQLAKIKNLDFMDFLINNGADIDNFKQTCLTSAIEENNEDMVKILVEKYGATVDFSNNLPILEACRFGNVGITRYLISKLDMKEEAFESLLPLDMLSAAIKRSKKGIIDYLFDELNLEYNRYIEYMLVHCAYEHNTEMAKYIIGKANDLNGLHELIGRHSDLRNEQYEVLIEQKILASELNNVNKNKRLKV